MNVLQAALDLVYSGIPVFPASVATKRPMTENGHLDATLDPRKVRGWFTAGGRLIGVPTGERSGFDVLDLDPRHGSESWRPAGGIPETRAHATRSGGQHLLFRHQEGVRNSQSKIAPGVDVRGEGGFIIWWPAHVPQPDSAPARDAEPWPADLYAAAVAKPPARVSTATLTGAGSADDALAEAVETIERAQAGERYEVCKAVTWRLAGLVLAGRLDESAARAATITAAEAAGGEDMEKVERLWDGALEKASPTIVPGSEFSILPPEPTRSMRLIFPADCATGPRRGYIVKHLIAPGDVTAIIGPPGCGKSMLAPYLAYAVAQGRPAFGLRTKQGRTLYVAAEDATGMRQRIHALRLTHGDAPDFAMVECGNMRDAATAAALRDTVAAWQPSLVIVDTLGAAFAGMDENSAADMGSVVALARGLAGFGCAVVLIHHIAKHGDGSPRGHSVLNGTLDMSLSLAPRDDCGTIRGMLLKNRSGTTDRTIAFRFVAVLLGEDEDGDEITAPMAIELDAAERTEARRPRLSPTDARALDILRGLASGVESGQVAEKDWIEACDDQRLSASDVPENRNKAFQRAARNLQTANRVQASGGSYWLTEQRRTAGNSEEQRGTARNSRTGHPVVAWNEQNSRPRSLLFVPATGDPRLSELLA